MIDSWRHPSASFLWRQSRATMHLGADSTPASQTSVCGTPTGGRESRALSRIFEGRSAGVSGTLTKRFQGGRRRASARWSLPQLLEQRLRLDEVARIEALGEPAVDRGEQVARLRRAALGLEPAAKARGRAQLERLRPMAPGEVHRLPVVRLHRGGLRALPG